MPDVTGVAQEQAEQALRDKGFLVAIDVQVSLKPPGTVITTDPVKGSYVEAGSKITLIVAKAAQTPTPSQTPTATESSTPPTTEPTVSIPPGRG